MEERLHLFDSEVSQGSAVHGVLSAHKCYDSSLPAAEYMDARREDA